MDAYIYHQAWMNYSINVNTTSFTPVLQEHTIYF